MSLAPTVKLNNGLDMPVFGLGTYLVSISAVLLPIFLINCIIIISEFR